MLYARDLECNAWSKNTKHYLIYIHIPDSVHIAVVSFSVPYGVSTFACLGSDTLQNIILPTTSLEKFDKSIVSTMLSNRFICNILGVSAKMTRCSLHSAIVRFSRHPLAQTRMT